MRILFILYIISLGLKFVKTITVLRYMYSFYVYCTVCSYCTLITYCSIPGKRPCTAFQGVNVAASIQTYGSYILDKRPYRPKSRFMFKCPWVLAWDSTVVYHRIVFNYKYLLIAKFPYICNYRTLVKEGPWMVHLTLGQNWGMGRYSKHQYCI